VHSRGTDSDIAALAGEVLAALPRHGRDVADAVLAEVPAYRAWRLVPFDELLENCVAEVGFTTESLRGTPIDARGAHAAGRKRAEEGMPLPDVMSAYRVGFARMWSILVAEARRTEAPDSSLLAAATRMWDAQSAFAGPRAASASAPRNPASPTRPRRCDWPASPCSAQPVPHRSPCSARTSSARRPWPRVSLLGHLTKGVLAGLDDLSPDERSLLLATFRSWIDHGGSATEAGRALYCHPNTVRYRLRKLEERTGRSVGDPRSMLELLLAAEADERRGPAH
jgi:hypothetical protein